MPPSPLPPTFNSTFLCATAFSLVSFSRTSSEDRPRRHSDSPAFSVCDMADAGDGDDDVSVYDEVEIEDMTFDGALQIYHYPCPCGDRFEIALADLQDSSTDIAVCPSCSLMIRVIYEVVSSITLPVC